MSAKATSPATGGLTRFIPAHVWLRSYQPGSVRTDVVADIALAACLPSGVLATGQPRTHVIQS